jgi:hypothetical protein
MHSAKKRNPSCSPHIMLELQIMLRIAPGHLQKVRAPPAALDYGCFQAAVGFADEKVAISETTGEFHATRRVTLR